MAMRNDGGRASSALGRIFAPGRDRVLAGTGAAIVALALVIGGFLVYRAANAGTLVTAYFSEAVGVYPGSTVRVLGVPVGTVDAVTPQGRQVKVTMTLDHGVAVPAGARAVVVAPSVVSDRYVQLTPAYTGGPQLADGAVIPAGRTAVPVEIDQIYAALDKLTTALGPNGANAHGALSNLIKTGQANLSGNGGYLHSMITQFSGLSKTLGTSSGNLFATVSNLQRFTTMLKNNDGQVRLAEQQLAQVSGFLAADRQNLAAAMNELATALGQVQSFIGGNRSLIKSNVGKLAAITSILVRERASLAQALDTVPLAADNLVNAYDATNHTLDGRGDLNELSMGHGAPGGGLTAAAGPLPAVGGAPAGSVPVPASQLGWLPPLPLPATGPVYGTPQALLARGHR
jgi:phospholipid/cholesterol/gamma-HCH transport system substrate-binding protein